MYKTKTIVILKQRITSCDKVLDDAISSLNNIVSITPHEGPSVFIFLILYKEEKEVEVSEQKTNRSKVKKAKTSTTRDRS